ncbi:MAG: transglutaminase family protein [Candidatus Hodarchaeota archaeon]
MSLDEKLGKDPAPAAIRYLVLLSALTCAITAITFLPEISGASTQEQNFYQSAIPGFTFFCGVSMVEWLALRRSRKMVSNIANVIPFVGPYGFTLVVEFVKILALFYATNMYVQQVDGASSSAFFLHQLTSIAIIFMVVITKVARERLEQLAEKNISKTMLNLLPTLLVIALFLGTYAVEIAGLGTPRQRNKFGSYTEKDIEWSMFNTPTWDATYILENLLDQFTAGLSMPDVPLFNVTSDQSDPQDPIVYWRLSSLESYEYTGKPPYTTDWNPTDSVKRVLSPDPVVPNTTYSHIISPSERTASFTVKLPLNHSDSVADVTIHPSFSNYLPTTWNGYKGSYISSNSFNLIGADGQPLSPTTTQAREIFPNAFASDLLGMDANIRVDETSDEEGVFEYTMDYLSPNIQMAAAFSLLRNESEYLRCVDATTWAAIKSLYLQLPNTQAEMPSQIYVETQGGLIYPIFNNYSDWAPTVVSTAVNWNLSTQTVFGQAYSNMQKLGNQSVYTFDEQMWLGMQTGTMDHPQQYEDYNEWFLNRQSGVSLHFASAYATIMRLQNIPSRVVIGYIGGNDSADYYPNRVITSRFLHAWAEVLVPIDTIPLLPGGERLEWISFDPLLSYLASRYGISLPQDIVPTSSEEQTTTIRPDYDLEGRGIAQAYIDDADFRDNGSGDWIIQRVTLNYTGLTPSPYTLYDGDHVNLSIRLITIPSVNTWLPYQGAKIEFYYGILGENKTGTFLDNDTTNSQGVATIEFDIDTAKLGVRTIYFYAEVVGLGTQQPRAGISLPYEIKFF